MVVSRNPFTTFALLRCSFGNFPYLTSAPLPTPKNEVIQKNDFHLRPHLQIIIIPLTVLP